MSVGVVGASGYAGAELLRLLAAHPDLHVAWAAAASAAGTAVADRYPGLAPAYGDLAFRATDEALDEGADVVFCALPHGESAGVALAAAAAGAVVCDLSADFRLLDPAAYPAWYGADHPAPGELGAWAYGLPELHRDELRGARKVAVPGCYPTAAVLALAPALAAGLVAPDGIVVDAKSGVSGAGRSPADATLFAQANESVRPYGAPSHRHTPEIEQELSRVAGRPLVVTFTPHLVPMTRGELVTCYATLVDGADQAAVDACYRAAYASEPFVDPLPAGTWPATRSVAGTNRALVGATVDARAGRLVVAAAIDNLGKGAAGQAVQCANLAVGLPETAGLDHLAPGP
ncbi:MAG TPA: N-acetyl-gamma-glutamyl-phosphate reductase [Acidimicrobiales bacterium]|jgi:N-acetyl-gamma-glutamyl-phosphate reductase